MATACCTNASLMCVAVLRSPWPLACLGLHCAAWVGQIMTERVQGLERELNSREVMLRQRENRLVNAEEQLGALTAELQGLKVKLKSVRSEAQGREENIRSALTSLANAKAENIELKVRRRCVS